MKIYFFIYFSTKKRFYQKTRDEEENENSDYKCIINIFFSKENKESLLSSCFGMIFKKQYMLKNDDYLNIRSRIALVRIHLLKLMLYRDFMLQFMLCRFVIFMRRRVGRFFICCTMWTTPSSLNLLGFASAS